MVTLKIPRGFGRWLRLYGLYRQAFPASERKPFGIIVKMYRKGVTDIWCVEEDGRFAGLAFTINGPDMILLDYFAIEEKSRGKGIGSRALGQLLTRYGSKGLFVEIESTLLGMPDHDMRERRKRFYISCGMVELGVTAKLFGVDMELLGCRCKLDFDVYRAFYRDNYGQWAAEHITR